LGEAALDRPPRPNAASVEGNNRKGQQPNADQTGELDAGQELTTVTGAPARLHGGKGFWMHAYVSCHQERRMRL
jgi:hypothetical protein